MRGGPRISLALNPGHDDMAWLLRCGRWIGPKKKAPNGGARLGGNPYMSLTSVTDLTVTFSYKYVASRTKVWKLVTTARDRIPFRIGGFLSICRCRRVPKGCQSAREALF